MKKIYYFIFSIIFSLPLLAEATHLMGGEITATRIGTTDQNYAVKLTVYRDITGIAMASTATLKIYDDAGTFVQDHIVPQAAGSGQLLRSEAGMIGTEVYFFEDTIALPGPGTFHIAYEYCCRNGGILNVSDPLSSDLYLETILTHFNDALDNSTARFLADPVVAVPLGQDWYYNPIPFEAHGDSLAWALDTPQVAFATNIAGYTDPDGLTLDPNSGEIYWQAPEAGRYDVSFLIEEYRDGNLIGKIRRDMQLIVIDPDTNVIPDFTDFSIFNSDGSVFTKTVNSGQGITFEFPAADPNVGDTIDIQAAGEAFMTSVTPATFTFNENPDTPSIGSITFTWMPDASLARPQPYLTSFRVWDHQFANDATVLMTVVDNTSIEEPQGLDISKIYPNPAKDVLNLSLNIDKASELEFKVYNTSGALITKLNGGFYPQGTHIIQKDISNLTTGFYILAVEQDGNMISGQKFTVIR